MSKGLCSTSYRNRFCCTFVLWSVCFRGEYFLQKLLYTYVFVDLFGKIGFTVISLFTLYIYLREFCHELGVYIRIWLKLRIHRNSSSINGKCINMLNGDVAVRSIPSHWRWHAGLICGCRLHQRKNEHKVCALANFYTLK